MSELYELPDGWEWKKLEDVFLIERGGSPRPIALKASILNQAFRGNL